MCRYLCPMSGGGIEIYDNMPCNSAELKRIMTAVCMSARTLYDVLAEAAQKYGEREFMIVGRRDEVATFRELRDRADAFGRMLAAFGIRPGDRVAIWMTNRVDWVVAAYGIARCGAVTVGVNTRLSPREVAHLLTLTRPRFWVLEESFSGKVDATASIAPVMAAFRERAIAAPTVLIRSESGRKHPGAIDWQQSLKDFEDSPGLPPAADLVAQIGDGGHKELFGAAVILSTSGTTSAPKGVMLGHESLIRLACAVAAQQDLTPEQRFYTVGPFFHCSGYLHGLLTNLVAGSTLFTSRRYTPEEAWDVFSQERINVYHGSIVPLQEIALLPRFKKEKIASLTRAWYSAPATEMARLEDLLGTRMCEIYGLTETGGNVSICHVSDPVEMRHDSDGRPHHGVEVSIVDPDTGRSVPDGTPGEIWVRGWNMMLGYFRDPTATAQAIDAEGWLHTGDQGARLPHGFVKFLSRLKDVIRVGGENLSPLEVEEVLMIHPDVAEAVVVAAPHDRLNEVPVAFLVLRSGRSPSPAELEAHCRRQLANFKVPARFIFVDDLPRSNAVMRVQKAKLREMLASDTAPPNPLGEP